MDVPKGSGTKVGFMAPFFRLVAMAALLAPCACASVKMPMPALGGGDSAADAAPLTEHTALREAADRLDALVPDAADDAKRRGLQAVVLGGRGDAEKAAAGAYLAALGAEAGRARILADAEALLSVGRDVAAAGLAGSGIATTGDIELLEASITDLQRCRRLMTTALHLLREDGAPLTKTEIRELGDRFVAVAREIGTSADLVAARADGGEAVYADRPTGAGAGY